LPLILDEKSLSFFPTKFITINKKVINIIPKIIITRKLLITNLLILQD